MKNTSKAVQLACEKILDSVVFAATCGLTSLTATIPHPLTAPDVLPSLQTLVSDCKLVQSGVRSITISWDQE